MRPRILTPLEHREITTFLEDVMYGRPVTITPALKRIFNKAKANIDTIRNHSGIIEGLMDLEEMIQSSSRSNESETK